MEKERNIPSIRFKGFTDPWEQRKLGDESLEIIAGGDVDKLKLCDCGKYPVIANAHTNDGIIGYYENDYRIKAPAVTVTGRGDVGHAQARKTDFTPVVRLLSVSSCHDVDFLAEAINQSDVVFESTGVPQLTVPKLANYLICFPPTLYEERKIGSCFVKMTNLITLHQRKLDHEKRLKEYLLQNMFPRKGKNVPKVRFWKFTDKWRPQKIGDLCLVVDTKHATAPITNQKTSFRMIRTDCIKAGQLLVENTDSVTQEIYEKWSERIHLQRGDLVFTREAPIGECAVIPDDGNNYFPGQRIVTLRSKGKVSTLFLNYLIYADEFRQEIRTRNFAATTVANFGIPAIKEYITQFPSIDEQNKIGQFFSNLDSLITLHQQKLKNLKEMKKGFLQKMFV